MTVSPKKVLDVGCLIQKVLDVGCLILRLRGANSLTFYVLFLYFTLFSFFFCSLVFVFVVLSLRRSFGPVALPHL